MSSQFNFYATYRDEEEILKIVQSVLGNFYIVPERGDRDLMIPKLMTSANEVISFCNTGGMFAIIKDECLKFFQIDSLNNDLFRINYRSFPCIEYSRSIEADEKTITLGRLVYFYDPKHPFITDVQKLFRSLKKISKRITEKSNYWIFFEASRCREYLKIHETWNSEKNPYFKNEQNKQGGNVSIL